MLRRCKVQNALHGSNQLDARIGLSIPLQHTPLGTIHGVIGCVHIGDGEYTSPCCINQPGHAVRIYIISACPRGFLFAMRDVRLEQEDSAKAEPIWPSPGTDGRRYESTC
jgi:hypothetical protein